MLGRRQGFWGYVPRLLPLLLIYLLPYTSAQAPALGGLGWLSSRAACGTQGCYRPGGLEAPVPLAWLQAGRAAASLGDSPASGAVGGTFARPLARYGVLGRSRVPREVTPRAPPLRA